MLAIPVLMSLMATLAPTAQNSASNLIIEPCDAGEHRQFDLVECDIPLKNIGDKSIAVSTYDASAVKKVTVPPHGTAYLKASVELKWDLGYVVRKLRLKTEELGASTNRTATIYAFVSTVLDQGNISVDFGKVEVAKLPVYKSVSISSREIPNFKILGATSKNDYISARVGEDGHSVEVGFIKKPPLGLIKDVVFIKINGDQQSRAAIELSANIESNIVPDANPLLVGILKSNSENYFYIRLSSRDGKSFNVGKITTERLNGQASVLPCIPASNGCKLLRFKVSNDNIRGRLSGIISVNLPDSNETLPILILGLFLDPNAIVHDVNSEIESKDNSSPGKSLTSSDKIDLANSIKDSIEYAKEAPPPGSGPLLKWSVSNQSDVYGFIIWRALSKDGQLLRVNRDIIKAVSNKTGSYMWRDNSAESGKTYWYSIGYVKNNGEKVDLSGRQEVTAK